MPSRDGCIQDLEGRQHNYVNTPTSHDPEQTPADVNGRREDYSSYNQLLCPVNLPLTSASLFNLSPTQPLSVHKTLLCLFSAPGFYQLGTRQRWEINSWYCIQRPVKMSHDTLSKGEIINSVLKVLYHSAVSPPTNSSPRQLVLQPSAALFWQPHLDAPS